MGESVIRIVTMPKDANPDGDVFGGWILSMMDIAGAVPARRIAKTRVVTVAMDNVKFHLPVFIGDCVECIANVEKVGNTSITIKVDIYVDRRESGERLKVTEGRLVYVAIDKDRNKIPVTR